MTHTPRIKELYAEGMKQAAIARMLGVARATVFWALNPEKHCESNKRWRSNSQDKYLVAQKRSSAKRKESVN